MGESHNNSKELLQTVDTLKEAFKQHNNPLAQLVSDYLDIISKQLSQNTTEADIDSAFTDIEMRITNLMNFWKEKEESGEGISNADDARHLVNEIDIIEDALAKIED